ncbi:hypothetical protein [Phytoactinopolyspora mesophila]|uniref:Uncharacterized protein n=1 Tax=Phytoactinopolyspora mesophila TaxID=2650750 RepID=A0A7K3M144_9ACTN|nr:hypothetical protein [Phytoactinopolyspora mesophila]NDL56612.1 hypothetical protein [Phytoactinopolyspora mesophila]
MITQTIGNLPAVKHHIPGPRLRPLAASSVVAGVVMVRYTGKPPYRKILDDKIIELVL